MNANGLEAGSGRGRRFVVRGRVQGVGFRAATRRRALALGVVGHASNLPDGAVEVSAAGRADALDALAEWLAAGPAGARVDAVEEVGECEVRGRTFTTG